MLLAQLEREGRRLASRYKLDGIPTSELILRVPAATLAAILAAAEASPEIQGLLAILRSEPHANFTDPRLLDGIAQLQGAGLLGEADIAAIMQRDRPERAA